MHDGDRDGDNDELREARSSPKCRQKKLKFHLTNTIPRAPLFVVALLIACENNQTQIISNDMEC